MGSSFFTWFFILLIIILSIFNTLFSGSRVIQVTNGASILDAEAPSGQRNRKWFLIIITCTNLLRLCTTCLTIYYLLKKAWTASDDVHTTYHLNISTWECWLIPSLPNYLVYIYFVHYLSRLYYKLQDANWKIFAYSWNIVNTVFWILCTILFAQQILIAESHKALLIEEGPPPTTVTENDTTAIDTTSAQHGVEKAFAHLCLVYGIYNLLIISTILYFLYLIIQVFTNCTFANPSRVLLRLSIVMGSIALLLFIQCIFYGEVYFTLDSIYGSHYDGNSLEILANIFLEVLGNFIILLTITNTCTVVEEKLRSVLQIPWIAQWMRRRASPNVSGKESGGGTNSTGTGTSSGTGMTTGSTDYSSMVMDSPANAMAVSLTTPTPVSTTSGMMMPSILHRGGGGGVEEGRPLLSSYLNPPGSGTGSIYGSTGSSHTSSRKSPHAHPPPILPTLNASVLLHPSHATSSTSSSSKPNPTTTTGNGTTTGGSARKVSYATTNGISAGNSSTTNTTTTSQQQQYAAS